MRRLSASTMGRFESLQQKNKTADVVPMRNDPPQQPLARDSEKTLTQNWIPVLFCFYIQKRHFTVFTGFRDAARNLHSPSRLSALRTHGHCCLCACGRQAAKSFCNRPLSEARASAGCRLRPRLAHERTQLKKKEKSQPRRHERDGPHGRSGGARVRRAGDWTGHHARVCAAGSYEGGQGPVWVGSAREGITVSPVCYVRPHS